MIWKPYEIEILKNNYNKSEEELLALLKGRTFKAILIKLCRLGISRSFLLKKFTGEEIELLKKNSNLPEVELLKIFPDRSLSTLCNKINSLGLPRDKGWSYFSDDEINIILSGLSFDEICKKIPNRTRDTISKKAGELGVELNFKTQKYEEGILVNDDVNVKSANRYLRHHEELGLKVCTHCKTIKRTENFKISKNGFLSSYCFSCEDIYKKEKSAYDINYNKKNKIKKKLQMKIYRENGGIEKKRIIELKRVAIKKSLLCDITLEQWNNNLKYFNYCCAYCGLSEEEHLLVNNQKLHKDHIIPQSKGGVFSDFNLIPSCRTCNTSKGTSDLEDFFDRYDLFTLDRYIKIIDFILKK